MKMIKSTILIVLFFLFLTLNVSAQKESWNWVLHHSIYISFNNKDTTPSFIEGSKLRGSSCGKPACISNSNGELLFYSGSQLNEAGTFVLDNVYNREHKIMENGESAFYVVSYCEQIILPIAGDTNLFYLIRTNRGKGDTGSITFVYDIIDMSKQNGLGEVIKKDTDKVMSYPHNPSIEDCAVFKHRNNLDSWLITWQYNFDKEYYCMYSYLFTSKGIEDTVFAIDDKKYFKEGYHYPYTLLPFAKNFKTAHNKKEFVMVYNDNTDKYATIFNFNDRTGKATEKKTFKICDTCNVLDFEYSPNGENLFFSLYDYAVVDTIETLYTGDTYLAVFDITGDSSEIENSRRIIGKRYSYDRVHGLTYIYGNLKAAPNGKIYTGLWRGTKLLSIDNPNDEISKIKVTEDAIDLHGHSFISKFPIFLSNYYNVNLELSADSVVCLGDPIILSANLSDTTTYPYRYIWTGPNGFVSDKREVIIPIATKENEGWYYMEATVNGADLYDSIYVDVLQLEKPKINGSNTAYINQIKIYKTPNPQKELNIWYVDGGEIIGENYLDTVVIKWTRKGSGKVILDEFKSEGVCKKHNEISVFIEDWPAPEIKGNSEVCLNDTSVYQSYADTNISYDWRLSKGKIIENKENRISIWWNKLGIDTLFLYTYNKLADRSDTTSSKILVNPNPPKPKIRKEERYLVTDEYDLHRWYLNGKLIIGASRNFYEPKESGKYQVMVIDTNGCKSELSDPYDLVLGIDDYAKDKICIINPNPAGDYIEINLDNHILQGMVGNTEGADHALKDVVKSVKIYNVLGELVISDVLHLGDVAHLIRLDVSSLTAGVYFVRVGGCMQKFVKL